MAEALITLSGFLVIVSISITLMNPLLSVVKRENFFTLLKADLYYAQLYALSHQREQSIIITGETNRYYINDSRYALDLLVYRTYPADIAVKPGTMPLTFKFLPDGNISRFGTILVHAYGDFYRITFQLGRGRFYVADE
ncbi:competence type IV pilus minor pilin ComGD [Bacillus sp. EB01]|uniref:competence type IV pilus minor pilin ComGD n=1 Tax=Bacillus sp. EB01 TaxID=1347086 RepID=UPI00069389DA|nr:competence type IV pilus minor pilin ComGD [Bacillus sp. EB01]